MPPAKPESRQTIGDLLSPSSISVDSICPCDSITHAGLTENGRGQLVLSSNLLLLV